MLRVGVQNVSGRRATFAAMDALTLAFRPDTFDAVVCQLGLMFFGDRVAALREMRRVLRPGGRVAIGVWGELDDVSFFAIVMKALIRQAPAEEERLRQGFSLGRPERLVDLLEQAG